MFFGCYRHLAQRDDVELRKLCCSQFTTVLKLAGPATFSLQFSNTLSSLSYDQSEEVRAIMAATFHEVGQGRMGGMWGGGVMGRWAGFEGQCGGRCGDHCCSHEVISRGVGLTDQVTDGRLTDHWPAGWLAD